MDPIKPTKPESEKDVIRDVRPVDSVEAPKPVPETPVKAPEVVPEIPEVAPEKPETTQEEEVAPEQVEEMGEGPGGAQPQQAPTAPQPAQKDRFTQEIESVMEEDLTEMFLKMTPADQKKFKETGEETASKIRELAVSARENAKKIFSLLKSWLKIIPGVNKLFLEQEAKIKTDKILLIAEEEKKRGAE